MKINKIEIKFENTFLYEENVNLKCNLYWDEKQGNFSYDDIDISDISSSTLMSLRLILSNIIHQLEDKDPELQDLIKEYNQI